MFFLLQRRARSVERVLSQRFEANHRPNESETEVAPAVRRLSHKRVARPFAEAASRETCGWSKCCRRGDK